MLLADAEQVLAEVVGLLEQGLLPKVVFDILKVAIRYRKLGGLVLERKEEFF